MLPIRCHNIYIYIYSYWYQQDKKILFIEYPSRLHETAVNEIRGPLKNAMKQQARESGPHHIMWKLDANLNMSCGDGQRDHGIPDLVVTDRSYAPYLVIEVAFSQSRDAVMAKAQSWLSHLENIGVIVIDVSKHRHSPTLKSLFPIKTAGPWMSGTHIVRKPRLLICGGPSMWMGIGGWGSCRALLRC